MNDNKIFQKDIDTVILTDEVETLNKKLTELTGEEMAQVIGGEVTSSNVVVYKPSDDTASDKPLRCMFGAPAIIR